MVKTMLTAPPLRQRRQRDRPQSLAQLLEDFTATLYAAMNIDPGLRNANNDFTPPSEGEPIQALLTSLTGERAA